MDERRIIAGPPPGRVSADGGTPELRLAKFLLWKILFQGEGPIEGIWKVQAKSVKTQWRQIAHEVLKHLATE